jgi:hypothetical protein
MSTATVVPPPARSEPRADATVVRFLTGWAVTVLPMVATVIALEVGWGLLDDETWPAAAAFATGSALATATWLGHRHWPAPAVSTVLAGPAAVLAAPTALGQLSPAGVVLWGPVSNLLAAALAMAVRPLAPTEPACAEPPGRD